jgi:hypothetical protein
VDSYWFRLGWILACFAAVAFLRNIFLNVKRRREQDPTHSLGIPIGFWEWMGLWLAVGTVFATIKVVVEWLAKTG